ncbi:VOC family protein [Streptomyces sp. NPDC048650]|uniref:VOC family protein n=1 Tax=unclassified Streptomyces TaxID=2593676 RepID=UPI003716487E
MTNARAGAPTMYPTVLYDDARSAIRQLTEAFGFTQEALHEDGSGAVAHAELSYGNGRVMLGSKGRGGPFGEAMRGAGPVGVYVVVEDTDAHFARASAAGAEILKPPADQDYGSRDYLARDVEGNVWSFGTYLPGAPS